MKSLASIINSLGISVKDILYSFLSGWNKYHYTNTVYRWLNNECFPVIRNMNTGEEFHVRPAVGGSDYPKWNQMVHNVPSASMIWPVDVVFQIDAPEQFFFVFKNITYQKARPLSQMIEERNVVPQTMSPEKIRLYVGIVVDTAADFYRHGYAYYGWNADHIWMAEESDRLYFDFVQNVDCRKSTKPFPTEKNHILYCDPLKVAYDDSLDYFALIVLLFYLLIGKFPYDGKLMSGIGKSNPAEMEIWYESYRKNCIFIFDPINHSNEIGAFSSEERYIERWKSLPQDLREQLISCFRRDEFRIPDSFPDPITLAETFDFFRLA